MQRQTAPQRWTMVILLGLFFGLAAVYGLPALAYRVSFAIQQGKFDAADRNLERRLDPLSDASEAFRMVAERVKPAVVHVEVVQSVRTVYMRGDELLWQTQQDRRFESGSGVIIDQRGYVLTNQHVVAGADRLQVKLSDQQRFEAELVGADERMDLALLRFNPLAAPIVAAKLGDSDKLAVGDWVLAIGNPFGLEQSVTAGIVSAKAKNVLPKEFDIQDLVQTDAAINPGNSGGPLVNLKGEVVGINTLIFGQANVGIGFAIPSNTVARAKADFEKYGQISRGWLGLIMHSQEPAEGSDNVLMQVDYVVPGGPGAKAGVQAGDLLETFRGAPILSARDLRQSIERSEPGEKVELTCLRDGASRKFSLDVAMAVAGARWLPGEREWGIGLRHSIPQEAARQLGLPTNQGLLIEEVTPDSPAAAALRPGELLIQVGDTPTPTLQAYLEAVKTVKFDQAVTLTVVNSREVRKVDLKPRAAGK